jgi:hypothetical protein
VNSIRFPTGLAIMLLAAGTTLFALSLYLEFWQLATLQGHPILVNLLSGAIGFCFGLPVLSLVINRVVESSAERRDALVAYQAVQELRQNLFNGVLCLRDRRAMAAAWSDLLAELDRRDLLGVDADGASKLGRYLLLVRQPGTMSAFCDVMSAWIQAGLAALFADASKLRQETVRLPELVELVQVHIRTCRVTPNLANFGGLIGAARDAAAVAAVAALQQAADQPAPPPVVLVSSDPTPVQLTGAHSVGGERLALRDGPVVAMAATTWLDGREVVAVAGEDFVELWDPRARQRLNAPLRVSGLRAVASVPGANGAGRLVVADRDAAYGWDCIASGRLGDPLFEDIGEVEAMASVRFRDGRVGLAVGGTRYSTLLATDGGSLVRLYDAISGERIGGFSAERAPVTVLATLLTAGASAVLAVGTGTQVRLWWDPADIPSIVRPVVEFAERITAMTSVPDPNGGHVLAVALADGTVWLWRPEDGEEAAVLPTDMAVHAMAAAGGHLVLGGPEGVVTLLLGHALPAAMGGTGTEARVSAVANDARAGEVPERGREDTRIHGDGLP